MSSKPWFAWFPADYRAKTAHLTFEQDGAYRRMLDAYYERRGPLPTQLEALYRLCSAQSESERKAVEVVVNQFFIEENGKLHHSRCDEQILKENELHNKWVEAGRKGGLRQAQGRLKAGSTIPSPSPHSSLYPQKTKKANGSAQAPFVLPDWVPEEQWRAFSEMRQKIRKPLTDYAKRLAITKLENYRDQGYMPAQVLMQSAFNGWAGLFPPKEVK